MTEYIDKKALITEIQSSVSMVLQTAPYEKVWFDRFVDRQNEIMAIIERQPAAEVEPVRHTTFKDGECMACGWFGDCVDTPHNEPVKNLSDLIPPNGWRNGGFYFQTFYPECAEKYDSFMKGDADDT